GIHGAGAWHRPGALTRIAQFRSTADRENIVIIAPVLDPIFNRPPNRKKDMKNGKFKDRRIIKDRYLWNFIMLINGFNEFRTDLKLIEIFEFFNEKLMKRDKFYLDGHSGGGQFVARFILFHPELIEKAAICSAGSFVFPRRDIDYPYGLKLDNLEKNAGPQIKADDMKLTDEQIDRKLNQLLDLKIFIIAGEKETGQEDRPKRDWQGKSTLEKAHNFYKAMKKEDKRLKEKGIRSPSKPYRFELHIIPDVGHNSHATAAKAIELLFPVNKKPRLTYENRNNPDGQVNATNPASSPAHVASSFDKYQGVLESYAKRTKVTSAGYKSGNRVLIQIDDHPFYINMPDGPVNAGLY
ncbi:alpha/beta hydrolase, partial [bacterium]|nr:alpha/beta hydrolase [bacterium]